MIVSGSGDTDVRFWSVKPLPGGGVALANGQSVLHEGGAVKAVRAFQEKLNADDKQPEESNWVFQPR
jgi:hypothetical protein